MEANRKNRYCVIMCGGVGSRFWPYSRQQMPKQFLDFFGTGRSMLQMTLDRVMRVVSPENVIIMTNADYSGLVKEQLPEVPAENILEEPSRRNTAPCIYWGASHILLRDPEASIVTLPSDHLILKEDAFVRALEEGFDFVEHNDALLTLGIRPTNPNTGYGYIQKGQPAPGYEGIMKVKAFTEKPDPELARLFVESGEFFWNSGIFLWRADTVIRAFSSHAPEIHSTFVPDGSENPADDAVIISKYPNAPCISVDYAIMEKASNVYVKTVDLGWSDLGTWRAFHEVSEKDADGNAVCGANFIGYDCSGSLFATPKGKLVVASGLKDYIVADTETALLIYPLSDEQKLRQVVNDVTEAHGDRYI